MGGKGWVGKDENVGKCSRETGFGTLPLNRPSVTTRRILPAENGTVSRCHTWSFHP